MVAKRSSPIRVVAPPEYKLPANLHREIGRIMVYWAYFENGLKNLLWAMIGVDKPMGRLTIRDPRASGCIEMMIDVAALKKIKIDAEKFKLLTTRTNEVASIRDMLAHGIWIPTPDTWLLQRISGSYPKDAITEHRKRRIAPEGVNVDLDGLRTITDATEMLIEMLIEIADEIAPQLPPSPEKHLAR